MGFLDDLLGNTSADAAKKAAADTYAKQTAAVGDIKNAGTQFAQNFTPWTQTGLGANDAVRNLMSDPSSVSSLPGYQFGLDQGNKSILAGNNATGNLFSGKTGKALSQFGTNYADQTYGNQLARLLGISQQGLGATGTGATGQLSANTSAYNGLLSSAGTIGQGDVAAANAKSSGTQNLLNTGANLVGKALPFFL